MAAARIFDTRPLKSNRNGSNHREIRFNWFNPTESIADSADFDSQTAHPKIWLTARISAFLFTRFCSNRLIKSKPPFPLHRLFYCYFPFPFWVFIKEWIRIYRRYGVGGLCRSDNPILTNAVLPLKFDPNLRHSGPILFWFRLASSTEGDGGAADSTSVWIVWN